MNHFFVVQNRSCPGYEFDTWNDASSFLNEMRKKSPNDWKEAQIVGPGLD